MHIKILIFEFLNLNLTLFLTPVFQTGAPFFTISYLAVFFFESFDVSKLKFD